MTQMNSTVGELVVFEAGYHVRPFSGERGSMCVTDFSWPFGIWEFCQENVGKKVEFRSAGNKAISIEVVPDETEDCMLKKLNQFA
ncbi:MAG: hypothetical protein NTW79_00390 [Candidatus Berkelbacteria bacterium]|nr:hypothetical protein [Candidatus Berkelbacteria bacterium]